MADSNDTGFSAIRKDFLGFLKFTKGYSDTTCYGYSSDLNRWCDWLALAHVAWDSAKPSDVENFVAYLCVFQ